MATRLRAGRIDGGCRTIDGKAHGSTSKALMPKGLTPEIQPVGQRQVNAANELLQRASERGLADNATLFPLFTELRANVERLQTGLDRRVEAYGTVSGARTAELMCREDFCTAYSKEMGLIRALYPDDRTMQEFFFDTFKKSSKDDEDDEEVGSGGGSGGGEGGS